LYNTDWLPDNGKGIWLWLETEDGRPLMPSGDPPPLAQHDMKILGEIMKGLDSFIAYWSRMANQEDFGDFKRLNVPLKDYWKGIRAALDEPLVMWQTLKDGFWPCSRITEELEDQMRDDGTIREEFA